MKALAASKFASLIAGYENAEQVEKLVLRRGGRVVECTTLEIRHTGNRIVGANPTPILHNHHMSDVFM